MPKRTSKSGSELFIVDNSDTDWKVRRYLHDWCQLSKSIDIATAYFEIGSLLALDGEWQKVDEIRLLIGDEVSKRTQKAFVDGLKAITGKLAESIETEKLKNDFLHGVPAIAEAIQSGKIKCRVYRKDKFHAKAYITHARMEVVGASALVGSSNFTYPGLTENIELNVQITGAPVAVLQEWYEEHWNMAEDVSPEILKTIEHHIREYTPFQVYAKSLHEYFKGREMTAGEWELAGPEKNGSRMYPVLDQYQKEGYQALMKIARQYKGAFMCDGVGLGKTFIGMMIIERLVMHERKRVMLLVPKAARKPVWEAALKRYLPHLAGDFSNLVIFNHTDLMREGEYPARLKRMKEMADAIVIDEAHHFRNPGIKGTEEERLSRYWQLSDIAEGKELFFLTATPVNNKLIDLQHIIELFSRREPEYFKAAPLGIHSLVGHFRKMENELKKLVATDAEEETAETNEVEAERVLGNDSLFRALVVQRSRAYVKKSQVQNGVSVAMFPAREAPRVADYSVKKTYGKLLSMLEDAFSKDKPLLSLALYYPLAFYKGPDTSIDPLKNGRQKEVVSLIRIQFLKRFESSVKAFESSCEVMMLKLLAFATKNGTTKSEMSVLDRWKTKHADLIGYVQQHQLEFEGNENEELDEDIITDEMLEEMEELNREEYRVEDILLETFQDLNQIAEFLLETKKFKPANDDKLKALINLLKKDPELKGRKVLIFSEYMATARYLRGELEKAGVDGLDEIDSAIKRDRGEVIRQFAPYYNDSSSVQLAKDKLTETRVLISTDVLSEGLNLQDATRLINYDIHWNPVRLMQRIGRVDRRMNPQVEAKLITDHPEVKEQRGKVVYWNFLPPDELDTLIRLYGRVSHKTLRISKTFGIEGKKLLRPDDDYEALKDFNQTYEGTATQSESMHLEYQKLLQDHPELKDQLEAMPLKLFSGKEHPQKGSKGVFFCYSLPAPSPSKEGTGEVQWTEEAGRTQWYYYDIATGIIGEDAAAIVEIIRSQPNTPRRCIQPASTLAEIREKMEKHVRNNYLKQVQAPAGIKPILKAWMELN